jgi:hypothetical protein
MRARTRVHNSSGTAGPASTLTLNLPTQYVNRTVDVTCDTPLIERSICGVGPPPRRTHPRIDMDHTAWLYCSVRERHHSRVALFICVMEYR